MAVFIYTLCLSIKVPLKKKVLERISDPPLEAEAQSLLVVDRALSLGPKPLASKSSTHSMTTQSLMSSLMEDDLGLQESFSEMVRIVRLGMAISFSTH